MKRTSLKYLFIIFLGALFLFVFSGCFTLGGLVLDNVKSNSETSDSTMIYQGWHQPEYNLTEIKLDLTNAKQIKGSYIGLDTFITEDELFESVVLNSNKRFHRIPIQFIAQTEIIPKEKSKSKAAEIGVILDVVTILTLVIIANTVNADGFISFGSN